MVRRWLALDAGAAQGRGMLTSARCEVLSPIDDKRKRRVVAKRRLRAKKG